MTLSYSENATLTCPSCGASFAAEVWMLIDGGERPDLAHALREGALNMVVCSHCNAGSPAGAPLLFHDPEQRRVYFAAPPGAEQHEWREQAQSLLYLLIDNLPEEARRPYLGDVQVEQEIEGVRRAILRRQGARSRTGAPPPPAHGVEHRVVEAPPPHPPPATPPPILAAVQALIAADSPDELRATLDDHPVLLDDAADAALLQLIETARDQGEREVAVAFQQARATLADLRASAQGRATGGEQQAGAQATGELISGTPRLPEVAYQAIIRVSSPDELAEAVRDYPVLLQAWVDDALAARAEAALDEGNERLARGIENRREFLADLRAEIIGQHALSQAVHAILDADGEDELAQVLAEYPALFTDAAQDALFNMAAAARARGDQWLADHATERRAMLREVRAGLEDDEGRFTRDV